MKYLNPFENYLELKNIRKYVSEDVVFETSAEEYFQYFKPLTEEQIKILGLE